jgi:hypothetical protein
MKKADPFVPLPGAPPRPRKRRFGLGDVVAAVAKPVAAVVDAVAGTKLKECEGCKGRRERMNRWF